MADRWLVRVGEKEYGPVELETLGDWKREGRLLPTNEVRRESDSVWTTANTILELFGPPPLPAQTGYPLVRQRSFGEIIRDSFRIYMSAFLPFFVVTLLIAIPTLVLELTSPVYGIFPQAEGNGLTRARVIALFAFIALVVNWPVFLAGIQIATVDVLQGRKVRVRELFRRAANFFPRFARLSLIVYGSYFLCTAIPVAIILSLASENPTILSLFLALLILAVQVVMVARLWVNFLFWQQSAYISNLEGTAALRESKMLARSRRRRSQRSVRPLWRGALLASLWLLIVLGLSAGAEIPLILPKLQSVSTSSPEEIMKMWQDLNAPKAADAMLIGSMAICSLIRALMRPILGIAFVLLYLDARTDFSESELAPPDPQSS
jgi:GYF domain 2